MHKLFDADLKQSGNYAVRDSDGFAKTYKEIFNEAELWNCIIETRSFVCVLCDNSFETICFILEMLAAGQVLWILDAGTEEILLDRLIDLYRPYYIWIGKDAGEYLISKCSLQAVLSEAGYSEHQLYRTSAQPYPIHQNLALLLSTSGSTGSPKMVRLSYDNLQDQKQRYCTLFHIGYRDKTAAILPLHHIYNLSVCIVHWLCGGCVLAMNDILGSGKFKDIHTRECANNIIGVPFTFKMMRKSAFFDQKTLENLHFVMSGGARLAVDDQKWLVSTLKEKFWIGYGQTETTALVIGTNFHGACDKLGTIGRQLDGVTVSLTDEQELVIYSKSVCMGYAYGYGDLCRSDENQGTIYTGDLAYIDEDGYIFLKGRKEHSVNIIGNRTNLDELETLLGENFPGLSVVCVGEDDKVAIFSEDREIVSWERNIRQCLLETTHIPPGMVSCIFIEKLPYIGNGKVDYKRLKEMMEGQDGKK